MNGCEVGLLIYGDAGASLDGFVTPLLGWRRRWYSMTHLGAYVVRYDAVDVCNGTAHAVMDMVRARVN